MNQEGSKRGNEMATLKGILKDANELVREWGAIPLLLIAPIVIGAYACETFATEPMVDTWYCGDVTRHFRTLRFVAVFLAEVWTLLTSGYGVI